MSGSALSVEAVVRQVALDAAGKPVFDVTVIADHFTARRQRAAQRWGLGCALVCRIEPADEAATWAQFKHLYGHLYTPVSKRHGEPVAEVNLRMKTAFMPEDGRVSLTQLNRAELASFIESVEQDIRETDPDSWEDCLAAMALYERGAGQRRTA